MADEPTDIPQADDPTATTPEEGLRLGVTASGSAHLPGAALEEGGKGKKLVRTRWPVDSFEHGLKDVPVITAAGVEIDGSKAKALNDLAAQSGIELEEVDA